jgi:putative toxin-antitoxin system antitoxin component (TIGR02293 family)
MQDLSTANIRSQLENSLRLPPAKSLGRNDLLKMEKEENVLLQNLKKERLKEEKLDRKQLIQNPTSDNKILISALKWMTQKGNYEDLDMLFTARQNSHMGKEALALITYAIKCISDRDMEERAKNRPAEILQVTTPLVDESEDDRISRFNGVRIRAIDVLGSEASADNWLNTPRSELDQKTPRDFLVTPKGAEIVELMLGRIEYGVYS